VQFTRAARPSPLPAMRTFKCDGGIPGASPSHWAPVWNVVVVIFVKQLSVRFLEMLTPHLLARVLFLFVSCYISGQAKASHSPWFRIKAEWRVAVDQGAPAVGPFRIFLFHVATPSNI
jgi:hypothetical protein